jgi:hypothetical protein
MSCISVSKPKLDWAAMIDREKEMIGGIPDSLAETLEGRGVDLFRDRAHFVGPNAVKVGSRTIEARHIVIELIEGAGEALLHRAEDAGKHLALFLRSVDGAAA